MKIRKIIHINKYFQNDMKDDIYFKIAKSNIDIDQF